MEQLTRLLSLADGARLRSVDLHVHTPASRDMDPRWSDIEPDQFVRIALAKGLEVIAVTDHNSAEWCDQLTDAAAATDLHVLPGVEISTSEGHMLAIFEPTKRASEIKELLIQVGIRQRDFGNLETIAAGTITNVASLVTDHGGVAIAAHVDRPKGFWMLTQQSATRRKQIYECQDIRALEIVGLELRDRFELGSASGYPRRATCIQGSDCFPSGAVMHQIDAVGERRSYLSMGDVSVSGLRQALLDPEVRVRLEMDSRPEPTAVIEGLWVSTGFLANQTLRFSENITCLIGGTGSGKSLSIELIRFALAQQVDENVLPSLAKEISRLLAFGMSDHSTVSVVIRKGGERYLVERAWSALLQAPVVSRINGGTPTAANPPIDVPTFFPIRAFSQSEIIEYAREPLARLSLLDDLIDTDAERAAIASTKNALRSNAAEQLAAQTELAEAEARIRELPGVNEEVERLSKLVQHPSVRQHQAWLAEQSELDRAKRALSGLASSLVAGSPSLDIPLVRVARLGAKTPSKKLLSKAREIQEKVETALERSKTTLAAAVEAAQADLNGLRDEWETAFHAADLKYQKVVAGLDPATRSQTSLTSQLAKLRERQDTLTQESERISTVIRPKIAEFEQKRNTALDALQLARRQIREKRTAKADELTQTLDRQVVIKVRGAAHARPFLEALIDLRTGSHVQEPELMAIASKIHPVPFVKGLLAGDYDGIASKSALSADTLKKFHENLIDRNRMQDLYTAQLIDVEDVVRIQFAVEEQTYRHLEDLAHGQKCTVVLMIALAEGEFPLLVDQPEDALHAPWIEDYIVSALRRRRGTRQSIFATRSANVLVSADAEQIIALKADAVHSTVIDTGSLDHFETRDLVLYHVEGGEKAFARRQLKYAAGSRQAEL